MSTDDFKMTTDPQRIMKLVESLTDEQVEEARRIVFAMVGALKQLKPLVTMTVQGVYTILTDEQRRLLFDGLDKPKGRPVRDNPQA